jgi:hypothetical protein
MSGNHATFGNGSTATTFPTKLPRRGYSFDGTTDYLSGLPALPATYTVSVLQKVGGVYSVVQEHVNTTWNKIITAGQFSGELLYLALYPFTLTTLQKNDEKLKLQKNINLI